MPREAISTVTIDMPVDKAWAMLQNFTAPHKYVPGLIKTEMHTEQTTGVGASRRVFKKYMAMDETITEWNESSGFTMRLHDGKKDKPFPKSYFKYHIEAGDNDTTVFTATLGYSFPLGVVGDFIDRFLIFPIVKAEIHGVAVAVKYFYETGKRAMPADIKKLKKVC